VNHAHEQIAHDGSVRCLLEHRVPQGAFDIIGERSAAEGSRTLPHGPDADLDTDGMYGAEGFVYQDLARLANFDGRYPVVGSWLIGHEPGTAAAGIGIRESDTPITDNFSQFVPHLFD
jgi:hypothetical protein